MSIKKICFILRGLAIIYVSMIGSCICRGQINYYFVDIRPAADTINGVKGTCSLVGLGEAHKCAPRDAMTSAEDRRDCKEREEKPSQCMVSSLS